MICILYFVYIYTFVYIHIIIKKKYCKEVSFYSCKMQSTLHQFNTKR